MSRMNEETPMAGELLPLFPLQVVLFPRSALPLHIFEERYKLLINECITWRKEFGINFVDREAVTPVGCTAVVRSVTRRYPDGRLDIVVEGRRRYRLDRYEAQRAPYLLGIVQYLADAEEAVDMGLAEETVVLFKKLVDVVYKEKSERVVPSPDAGEASFVIAQKAGLDLQQRQRLLETVSENDRLRMLKAYLSEVIPKLEHYEEVERVIRSDGYV